ncbi:MAG TPA: class I SAM-dependent methyltransferase [Phycisphaerae bacterium]|nr:class I SAM-dependent methyltransferase [Phycisphaerae bacterium]
MLAIMGQQNPSGGQSDHHELPGWYDDSIDWAGRLQREIPILTDVFGPPGAGGLLDAGCGTGQHAIALARRGYRVVGADISPEMLEIAREHAREKGAEVALVLSPYATLQEKTGGGFDGVFCLANSLTSAGTADAVVDALQQFARCLRPGGRFYIEVLNFTPMLPGWKEGNVAASDEEPHDRTPDAEAGSGASEAGVTGRVTSPTPEQAARSGVGDEAAGYRLDPSSTQIARVRIVGETPPVRLMEEEKYRLYPVSRTEFETWCRAAGLRIDEQWGSVLGDPYDVNKSVDMISIGTRV